MNTQRRNRLVATVFLLGGTAITAALVLTALEENVNLFYPPERVVNGDAPTGVTIRAGGMVVCGSVAHDASGLGVSFVLTDYQGSDFMVRHVGILPDLFREGQGILVTGQLDSGRVFRASEVLAKHDENYMPPEMAGIGIEAEACDPPDSTEPAFAS
ncbi:MAG: cytochrome c maturation protein CcmE [Gammaproteobacteria bacterium]|nr:cytochrome c maturation protein CcmE [Gammaproteobacteria bacterium]